MAYQRNYGYQYDTNPRKVQPEYPYERTYEKKSKRSSTLTKGKIEQKQNEHKKNKTKAKMHPRLKLMLYMAVGFLILFGISYRNSLITERFNEKEDLKGKVSSIQKENEQLKVNIESSLNLNNVEQMAKEKLGMQKLDNSQKIYVSLPKKDYIEAATEEVVIQENLNIWQKILKGLTESITGQK